MYFTPDTTAILVADRRSAREHFASRRRTFARTVRRAVANVTPAPAPLAAPIGRTPVEAVCRAA